MLLGLHARGSEANVDLLCWQGVGNPDFHKNLTLNGGKKEKVCSSGDS